MAYTTITAATIGLADGDQNPAPVDGTVRITPRFPSAATSSGLMATGPVIVSVTGGAMAETLVPAQEDGTALVEFHLYDPERGPVRMPSTEIPTEPDSTISLHDFLPAGVDPASRGAIARGERGYGIDGITASEGVVTVVWGDGEDVKIPIPTAALATTFSDGLMSKADKAEHDYLMDAGLVQTESIDPDEVQLRFDDSSDPILRISSDRGIVGTRIEHEPDTVDASALTPDVRDRVLAVEEIPDWVGWDFAFATQDGRVVFGRRSDGSWSGTEDMPAMPPSPQGYVAYGDSTTQGVGVDGVTAGWVDVLRDEYGINITNAGLSGARAEEITARLGGLFPTATVTGGEIPASSGVTLEGFDIDMLRAGTVAGLTMDLITEDNTVITGRLYRTGVTERQFNRLTPGDPLPASGRVELSSVTGRDHSSARIILGQGINNEGMILSGEQSIDDLIAWYSSAAAAVEYPIIVWGVLDRGPGEAAGTPRGNIITALEAWLRERFGADYWPVRQYLASPGALTDAVLIDPEFEATPEDLTAQESGTVPPSFRTRPTSVHLNEFGHRIQARFMYRQIIKRGWK